MSGNRWLAVGMVVSTLTCASCSLERTPTVDELIAHNVEARGGASRLDAIENLRTRVRIIEPTYTVVGDYRATTDGRMRIDVFTGARRVFSEGIDGDGAWQRAGGDDAPITPSSEAGRAALLHGIEFNLFGLHRFAERGHTIELDGREVVDGTDYYVLHVTLRDGFETWLYLDPSSWMIGRQRDVRALHPDMDPDEKVIETVAERFGTHCGVETAIVSKHKDVATGDVLQTTELLTQECNLPPDELALPRDAPAVSPEG